MLCLRTSCVKGKNLFKICQLSKRQVILRQVVQFREMETVGNSLYSLVNEEKGVIPPQAEQRNGLLRVYNESARFVLDWCCGPISTNTGLRVRWTLHVGDLQHVILYHKEHISSPKKTTKTTLQLLL